MNRPKHVKVPEGMYKRIYTIGGRKFLADIVFWYKLKAYTTDGFLKRGNILAIANQATGYSESGASKKIRSLIGYSLITETSSGIHLSSYDYLFGLLGYDLTPKNRNGRYHRKGSFKIWKLPTENIGELVDFMMYYDIHLVIQRQKYIERSKLKRHERYNGTSGEEKNLDKLIAGRITLSCRGTAEMFGYKSKSKGHEILHKLKKLKMIKLWGRYKIISTSKAESQRIYEALRAKKKTSKYKMMNGLLYEILANGIDSVSFY
jgi:hypothetical protein